MGMITHGNLAYQHNQNVQTRTVKRIKKHSIPVKEKLFYLFAVIFIAGLAGVVISGYAQIAEYNYSIQKVEKSIESIRSENEQLHRKIAELSTPERIINIAQNELGMKLNEDQVIVLSKAAN